MVLSMTGYGSASAENQELKIDIEVKSLNSKFLDLNLRLPRLVQPLEMEIRNLVNRKVKRGKVSLNINVQVLDVSQVKRDVNSNLFQAYYADLKGLVDANGLNDSNLLQVIMNMPDVLEASGNELSDETSKLILNTASEAMTQLEAFRKDEGQVLKTELVGYADIIKAKLGLIDACKDQRTENVKARLKEIQDKYLTPDKVDPNRMEQELVYYLEKLEITEEIVRLGSHLNYFKKELDADGSGKKLGFIAQEMGREINTIGSKANDEQIQHLVVEMKEELEKIKEQVLNLL